MRHPALRAAGELGTREGVIVRWADGEEFRLVLDSTPDEAEDMEDGREGWLGYVREVITPGRRSAAGWFVAIDSHDPPVMVMSPDRKRIWTAEPA